MNLIPDRAMNPQPGDVWRREWQRDGDWYASDERLVKTMTTGPTVAKTRLHWVATPRGVRLRGGWTSSKVGSGRTCSLAAWRGWARERHRVSRWNEPARFDASRMLLIVDGTERPPTRHEVLDLVRRLAERDLADQAEELAFIVIRGWGIDPDRIRDRMRWARDLL